jgi:hypothetical protein
MCPGQEHGNIWGFVGRAFREVLSTWVRRRVQLECDSGPHLRVHYSQVLELKELAW